MSLRKRKGTTKAMLIQSILTIVAFQFDPSFAFLYPSSSITTTTTTPRFLRQHYRQFNNKAHHQLLQYNNEQSLLHLTPPSQNDDVSSRVTTTTTTGKGPGIQTRRFMSPGGAGPTASYNPLENQEPPHVYPQRWIQLAYLSALALLSDWICFSVAAAPSTFESTFHHSAAGLIDVFLFTNVISCFFVTDIVNKVGLQKALQGAAALMAVGCWFRSGLGFVGLLLHSGSGVAPGTPAELVPYSLLVAGTIMVGAAQPFFQCTPPLLSAQWFAPDERATSTAIALNFNQIGIATAFLVGGSMATTELGMEEYFGLIALLSTATMVGTLFQLENLPPTPPSVSELEKLASGEKEPPFLESARQFFSTPGFARPLAAFICSISITNIVGTFIDEVMERGGITQQFHIDLAGAGFELAILVGGIVIGGYVDRTKEYKRVTLACLAATALMLIPLGLTDHALGQEPVLLLAALLGLGMAAGPVQPINAELAVDVTYPGDETAVESVQQIGGNLVSALLVPLAERAAHADYQLLGQSRWLASDIRGDVILLTSIACITFWFFSGFNAPLKRSAADQEGTDTALTVEMVQDEQDQDNKDDDNKSQSKEDNEEESIQEVTSEAAKMQQGSRNNTTTVLSQQ